MTSIYTNNGEELFFRKIFLFSKIFFGVCRSEPGSSGKMSSNGRYHHVWLAEKLSWIWSDGPQPPKKQSNEQKMFY